MSTWQIQKGGRRWFGVAAIVLGLLLVLTLSPAGAQDEPEADAGTFQPLSPWWGDIPVRDGLSLPDATGDAHDGFGAAVALSGDTAAVGAPADDFEDVRDAGAVHVYVRDGRAWIEQGYLTAAQKAPWDRFGSSLALDGDTLVVGGDRFNDNSSALDRGDVYVFVRVGTTWTEQAHLLASNAQVGDGFGIAVAISGDTLVVGAPLEDSNGSSQSNNGATDAGAAYVFTRNGTTWSQTAYLKAGDNLHPADHFGMSVAIEGKTVLVGAPDFDGAPGEPANHGEVFLFRLYETGWEWDGLLAASNLGAEDQFGRSVSMAGDTIVVGAPGEDGNGSSESDNSAQDAGAAYVFSVSFEGRVFQRAYLKASNADAVDHFGGSVATDKEALIVGAWGEAGDGSSQEDNSAELAGAAYVFAGGGTDWEQVGYLKGPSVDAYFVFGSDVAIDGGQVVVGEDFTFYDTCHASVYILDYQRGPTVRVSVDSSGNQGFDSSISPAISTDGRYVAFVSSGPLVSDDTNGTEDIYVHDRQSGQTTRTSVDSLGRQGDGYAWRPTISADGRYVAFQSDADGLDGDNANGRDDVFVRDRNTGQTRLVSADAAGNPGNHASWAAAISADGRYVAFASNASDLVSDDTQLCEDDYYGTISCADIFVRDLQTGQISRVSLSSSGQQGNAESYEPEISADGRYIVFQSAASNLVEGDTNGMFDVFVHDRQTGETTRVSLGSAGTQGNGDSEDPILSADGRYVAFHSYASNLVSGDTQICTGGSDSPYNCADIFIHDRQTGRTTLVSVNSAGTQGNQASYEPAISADGRYVGFFSTATNLAPGDTNNVGDVFIHDRYTAQTRRVSVGLGGRQGQGGSSGSPAFSPDGRYVAFDSSANNLVPGDINGHDVFVHDLRALDTSVSRASVNSAGEEARIGVEEEWPDISANGRFVVFQSAARNLDSQHPACGPGSTYVHDRLLGRTVCVSTNEAGDVASFHTSGSTISANGRFVVFASYTDGLVPGDSSGMTDIFVRDLQTGRLSLASVNNAGAQGDNHSSSASISADGRFVVFASAASNLAEGVRPLCADGSSFYYCTDVYLRDRQTGQTSLISMDSMGRQGNGWNANPVVSADGRYVAFASEATNLVGGDTNNAEDIFVRDRQAGLTSRISVDSAGGQGNNGSMWPSISSDGRYVAFTSNASNLVSGDTQMCQSGGAEYNCEDVFVHDRQTGQTTRLSVDANGSQGNASSYGAAIAADGRYVVFASNASNLVGGDTNGVSDVFIRDLQTGQISRLSPASGGEADGASAYPAITPDGRYVAFLSEASNLVSGDTNVAQDVFVVDREAAAAGPAVIDVDISLYANPSTSAARAPYERLIGYFADAVYESSNGTRKLGTVTFYTAGSNLATADIVWTARCWPSSQVSGYTVPGMHVNMCDVFADGEGEGIDYNFMNDDEHGRGGGYTLAHEWGHYYFGLYDEYVGDPDWDSTFYLPHSTDVAVPNSIMNSQWNALAGNNNWLNFSIARNDAGQTAQYRVYGASGWDTLIRPATADPRDGQRVSLPRRTYYDDLLGAAPWNNQAASIQLPTAAALSDLKLVWPSTAAQAQDAAAMGYAAQLNSVLGQSIASPDPILLLAFVHKDRPLTGVGVQGNVRLPNGSDRPVTFSDNGQPPDAVKGDGLYSAILSYRANGVYSVRVDFDNHAGTAAFVSTSFQPTTGVNGQPIPLPPPAPVSADFAVWATLQVTVSGVVADDHGNAPGSARLITADNMPWTGRIDRAGDKDVFRLATLDSGVTYVRVSNLALGMNPRLRVFGPDGKTVLFTAGLDDSVSEYPFIPLLGVAPGTTVYVEVSHASATASDGLYEISAGAQLTSDTSRFRIFLPHTLR